MNVLLDTNALFWYLEDSPSLGKNAEVAIDKADQVVTPTIVLLELLYLLKKKNRKEEFAVVLDKIIEKEYKIVSLDLATAITTYDLIEKLEMHDAVIVSSAKLLGIPLVTRDRTIRKVYKNTIW